MKRRYRGFLIIMIICSLVGIVFCKYEEINQSIPEELYLYKKEDISSCRLHAVNLSLDHPVKQKSQQTYQANTKVFGILPGKKVSVNVVKQQKVYPSGKAVGIYLRAKGLIVLGNTEIRGMDGKIYHPANGKVQEGDYLVKLNGTSVRTIAQVSEFLQKNGSKPIEATIRHQEQEKQVRLQSVKSMDGSYQLGIWLREDTEGIGTMTCVTLEKDFVALGHGITDIDTGQLFGLRKGGVYPANITKVVRGKKGEPGKLTGTVSLEDQDCLGSVTGNDECGLAGHLEGDDKEVTTGKALPIGLKQDIRPGKATIYCQVEEEIEEYEIRIQKVNLNSNDQKDMVISVTDSELLRKTGGIVQGMSGSPIIQDGKIIGAVTHVFVDDPTRGYGIFIEEMLRE